MLAGQDHKYQNLSTLTELLGAHQYTEQFLKAFKPKLYVNVCSMEENGSWEIFTCKNILKTKKALRNRVEYGVSLQENAMSTLQK